MVSVRPVTLKSIVKVLELLRQHGSRQSIDDLARNLGISVTRAKEIVRQLEVLKLVTVKNNLIAVSEDGIKFLDSYKLGDIRFLHLVFMRLDAYRKVFSCYSLGIMKPSEIKKETNLGIVTIDVALRIIREIRSLNDEGKLGDYAPLCLNQHLFKRFTNVLIKCYEELAKARRSKYVPLFELRKCVISVLGVDIKEFSLLLEELIRKAKGHISITSAPYYAGSSPKPVALFGRKYAYIMINKRGMRSCLE